MKIFSRVLLLCATVVFAAAGCSDNNKGNDPETYAITVNADDNGSAQASIGGDAVDKAPEGTTVTLTAMANTGYEFSKWTVESGGVEPVDATSATTTFTMPANAVSIKAEFALVEPSATYNNDADLWANTATLTLANIPDDAASVIVSYKKSTETEWQAAAVDGTKASIAPVWEDKVTPDWFTHYTDYTPVGEAVKVSVSPYSRIKKGTGVFAGNTYDYKLTIDGTDYTGQFTTATGDVIPNGDMSGWSTIPRLTLTSEEVAVAYPNALGNSFWDSGNNGITQKLCVSDEGKFGKAKPAAKMKSLNMFVMAAGNMFTGSFHYADMTGTVKFGQKYEYTARPSALKVKYHATVGAVNLVRSKDDICPYIAKNNQDRARIYVAIVDWSKPHTVISATSTTSGAWDPELCGGTTDDGKVIGYGSVWISATTVGDDMVDAELPIQWYDKVTKPALGNYSIVISCACNAFGDFFTGCATNEMYVDDFEWVY